jgi:hypothetical protein
MAGQKLNAAWGANAVQISVPGVVATANSTSPTISAPTAAKFTVSKSATGLLKVTFSDVYAQFLGVSSSVGAANATTAPTVMADGYFWDSATNTVTIMLVNAAGTLTNPGATETVSFVAFFTDSITA